MEPLRLVAKDVDEQCGFRCLVQVIGRERGHQPGRIFASFSTVIAASSLHPSWNESFQVKQLAHMGVHLTIGAARVKVEELARMDHHFVVVKLQRENFKSGQHELLGNVVVPISRIESHAGHLWRMRGGGNLMVTVSGMKEGGWYELRTPTKE
eukprot:749959-Hanusia_phi.AAC.2